MTALRNGARIWALVCNPTRARVLRGLGPVSAPFPVSLSLRARHQRLRAFVAAPAAQGEGRAQVRARLEADRRAFAAEIAALLETHRLAGELTALVAAAPPPFLRDLHDAFVPGLRRCVIATQAVDLTATDEVELRRRLIRLIDGLRDAGSDAGA